MRTRLSIALALLGLSAALPGTALAAPVGGLQLDAPITDGAAIANQLDLAKKEHAKVVRVNVAWNVAEPTQGQFDANYLASLDALGAAARSRGLQTIVTVLGSPCWASSAPDKTGCTATSTPDAVAGWQPTDGASVAGIFGQVARHVGPENDGIEVWNEPDQANELYFKGPNKSAKYVAVLKAAYTAIKAVNPNVKVLGGAIVGFNGVFLQNMYAQGAKGYYDALDVHYYDVPLYKLRLIHKVMKQNGDNAPIWLGEFGFDSCAPERNQGPHACLTRKNQARALADVFAAIRRTPWLTGAIVYSLRDIAGAGQFKFGVLDAAGKAKPSYSALSRAFTGKGKAQSIRLRLSRSRGRTRVRLHGPYGDIYSMTVRVHGQLRYKATFALSPAGNFSLLLPAVLGDHGVKVRVTFPWNGHGKSKSLG